MYRFRLSSQQVQVELVANGQADRLPFQVIGPPTEAAFLEELIEEQFGSLSLNPNQLFQFLGQDPWVLQFFQAPQLVEGELEPAKGLCAASGFGSQTLGSKLVQAGVLELDELEALLEEYRPFAETLRFGEFLRLNLQVTPQLLELLLNPSLLTDQGFNEKRLGERLLEMGLISQVQLETALSEQSRSRTRLGEILAAQGAISPTMARFFSEARINERGEIEYSAA